jgi:hypothetical protein
LRSFAARVNLGPTVAGPFPKTLAWLAGTVALLLLAWLSPRAVPFNMDELVHYHALGCATAPLQRDLPLIRDGCGYHDLRLPFTTTPLPLRSYLYTGSFPALPFYSFWRLLDDPVSARVQGAVFFLLVVFMAARLLRARPSSVLLAALVYPVLLAAFLVDEGPVGLSAVLLLAALLAARRSLAAGRARSSAAWAALAGLLLFLGLWTKLVFAWWLPAAAAFALAEARAREGSWHAAVARHRGAVLAGLVALVLPTALLLVSVDREGRLYAAVLRQGKVSAETERVEAAAGRLAPYLVDGSRVAPRNLLLPRSLLDPLPLALAAGILLLGARRIARRRAIAGWGLTAALTFALASSSEYSQWPHHFAFPLLLLAYALALALDASSPRTRGAVAVLVLLFWATLAARWPSAQFPGESSPAKDELLRFVRARGLDRESLQLHASWGTYYIAQLFGDRERLLLYMRSATDDPKRLETARALAAARGRSVLLVSSRRWVKIQSPAVDAVLGRPRATWRFGDWWAVEYDPVRSASPRP